MLGWVSDRQNNEFCLVFKLLRIGERKNKAEAVEQWNRRAGEDE